jgi:division protein CdvB (Snf7/Vps24/ESCRT-III family)
MSSSESENDNMPAPKIKMEPVETTVTTEKSAPASTPTTKKRRLVEEFPVLASKKNKLDTIISGIQIPQHKQPTPAPISAIR